MGIPSAAPSTYYSRTSWQSDVISTESDCIALKHNDLIYFFGLLQYCKVDLSSLKWQPALEILGAGGSANVSLALINVQTSFALERQISRGRDIKESICRLAMEGV